MIGIDDGLFEGSEHECGTPNLARREAAAKFILTRVIAGNRLRQISDHGEHVAWPLLMEFAGLSESVRASTSMFYFAAGLIAISMPFDLLVFS